MPRVPTESPQIGTDVPGNPLYAGQLREFGAVGRAIKDVGDQISNQALSVYDQVKQGEAHDAASQAYYADKLESEKKMTELKLGGSDGYVHAEDGSINQNDDGSYRTITQEYKEWADHRFKRGQEAMPNAMAAQLYKERSRTLFGEEAVKIQNEAQILKVKSYDSNLATNVQDMGNQLTINPDLNKLYLHAADIHQDVLAQIGTLHNATEASDKMKQAYAKLSHDLMQGAYTQVLAQKKAGDITRAQQVTMWREKLAGTDQESIDRKAHGLPTLSDMMDPVQHSVEEEKLIRMGAVAKTVDMSDFQSQFKNTLDAQKNGNGDSNAFRYTAAKIIEYGKLDEGGLGRADAADKLTQLYAARAEGMASSPGFKFLPADQQMTILNNATAQIHKVVRESGLLKEVPYSNDIGKSSENALQMKIQGVIQQNEEAKKKDWAAVTQASDMQGNPSLPSGAKVATLDFGNPIALGNGGTPEVIQRYLRESKALFKHDPSNHDLNWQPLTKEQAVKLAGVMSNPQMSDEQVGQGIIGLKKAYGADFPKALDQMIKEGSLPQSSRIYALYGNKANSETMTSVVSAIRGNKAIATALSDAGEKEGEWTKAAGDVSKDWVTAQINASPQNLDRTMFTNSINEAVKNRAAQLWMSDRSLSKEDASKTAFHQIVGQYTHTTAVGGGFFGGGTRFVVDTPKNAGGYEIGDQQNAVITANLGKIVQSEDELKKFSPFVPIQANGQPSPVADKFLPQVARTGRASYVASPTPGYHIWYKSGTDGMDKQLTTKDAQGNIKPVLIPLERAMSADATTPEYKPKQTFNPRMGKN